MHLHSPERVTVVIVIVMMTMAMGAVHVAVRNFLVGRGTHFSHIEVESEGHAG